jgi:hypothetical protein
MESYVMSESLANSGARQDRLNAYQPRLSAATSYTQQRYGRWLLWRVLLRGFTIQDIVEQTGIAEITMVLLGVGQADHTMALPGAWDRLARLLANDDLDPLTIGEIINVVLGTLDECDSDLLELDLGQFDLELEDALGPTAEYAPDLRERVSGQSELVSELAFSEQPIPVGGSLVEAVSEAGALSISNQAIEIQQTAASRFVGAIVVQALDHGFRSFFRVIQHAYHAQAYDDPTMADLYTKRSHDIAQQRGLSGLFGLLRVRFTTFVQTIKVILRAIWVWILTGLYKVFAGPLIAGAQFIHRDLRRSVPLIV